MIRNLRSVHNWFGYFNRNFKEKEWLIKESKAAFKKVNEKFKAFKIRFTNPEKRDKNIMTFLLVYLSFTAVFYWLKRPNGTEISLERLKSMFNNSEVDTVRISKVKLSDPTLKVSFRLNGVLYEYYSINLQSFENVVGQIQQQNTLKTKIIIEDEQYFEEKVKRFFKTCTRIALPIIFPILLFTSRLGTVLKSKVFGQSQTSLKTNVFFKDIAGLGNSKIEVSELVDFLKNPEKYRKIGAKVPKGALMSGPPGTGKTMLAKACAGEANVPFFSVSGSEFVELFAGMGAHRVRQLFSNAKKQTPAIIFIDEIDAIGRKREDKFGGAHDERANTLNQLLVEMDGFGTMDDIIVLAATNRKEMLDNALTRPGRFDRIVEIQLPDLQGRKQILEIYLKKIKLSPVKTLEEYSKRLATLTFGFSGADLANLCNEAAILAVRKQKKHVEPQDFESASDRVLAGLQQPTILSSAEKKRVAFHEGGHAVTAWFLQGASPLLKITIIPRSKGALGFAQYLPSDSTLFSHQDLIDQICVILGGRVSEEIFFGEISSGASDDLKKVRKLAYATIVSFGMSERNPNFAPIATDGHNIYSEATAAEIDKQIIQLIDRCTEKTRQILKKHEVKIKCLAQAVIQKQTLNHQEIKEILGERPFPSKENYKEFIEEIEKEKKTDVVV